MLFFECFEFFVFRVLVYSVFAWHYSSDILANCDFLTFQFFAGHAEFVDILECHEICIQYCELFRHAVSSWRWIYFSGAHWGHGVDMTMGMEVGWGANARWTVEVSGRK